jgi:hypothetical protein
MRQQGKISTWKDDKGFGFITPLGGGSQVFVHIKSFKSTWGQSKKPYLPDMLGFYSDSKQLKVR